MQFANFQRCRKPIIVLSVLALILSCNSTRPEQSDQPANEQVRIIDLKAKREISIWTIFSEIEIIQLETKEESIIKRPSKIIKSIDLYYILDTDQGALFRFNHDGTFKDKISNLGSGPGEYSLLYDFQINRFTGNIELLDPRGKILIYSSDLEFIEAINIPIRAIHNFFRINEDTLVFYTGSEIERLMFFSIDQMAIISRSFQYTELAQFMPRSHISNSPFHLYDNKILFSVPYCNEIFEISGGELVPYTKWEFGQNNFSFDQIKESLTEFNYTNYFLKLRNKAYSFYYYYENTQFIFTRFVFNSEWLHLIIDKKNDTYFCLNKFSEGIFPPIIGETNDKEVLSIVEYNRLLNVVTRDVLSESQQKIMESIRPDDNPLIIKYKFKQDDL
jgi:hypothetical protein